MDIIQQLILNTYKEKPKHFTQILKRNSDVIEYIKQNVPKDITTFVEQLYFAVYRKSNICPNGNIQPLKTFAGYSFCGKTGVCKCAKESVSKSVSESKKKFTNEQLSEISKKRAATNLSKYGVINIGMLDIAKENHKLLYEDKDRVEKINKQIKDTKLEKYGTETYNNRSKAESTCLHRYGVKNTWSLTDNKQNPLLVWLKDKDKLSMIYPRYSISEISNYLNVHEHTVHRYVTEHGFREPYKSSFEKEIIYFLESLGVSNIEANKRTIIGKELDIYLPDNKLAIEYNGIYWHHDKIPHVDRDYHRKKFLLCEEKGIELFTIFSDSWENKKEIWKKKIVSKLGLSERIYARKTTVVKLENSQVREILDNNHIQGYTVSQISYGLKYNDEIVAAMTFSQNRSGIGKNRGNNSYELVRFVSSKTVVGGASRLLSAFINDYNPSVIVSYSDNKYSVGNLYKVLGFELEKDNKAGYFYYDPYNKKTYHRYNFRKDVLVKLGHNPSKTEFEITDSMGLLRIWDCGSRTWILNLV